jgi:ssDNA-binding Zn-finger/Zn-ribbon topoisomerase 1
MSKKPPYWGMSNQDRKRQLVDEFEMETLEHNERCNPLFSINPKISGDCKCGGNYILRQNSKNGEYFYGCSNYPKCTNTQQITYEQDYLDFEVKQMTGKKKDGKYILDIDNQYQEYLVEKAQQKQKSREVVRDERIGRKSNTIIKTHESLETPDALVLGPDGLPIP